MTRAVEILFQVYNFIYGLDTNLAKTWCRLADSTGSLIFEQLLLCFLLSIELNTCPFSHFQPLRSRVVALVA
uniref:Uncharacterized protein n=1 Tax=Rhizophora mucronata TaxID=61149 RepID=A0A2P2NHF6_RHIMU